MSSIPWSGTSDNSHNVTQKQASGTKTNKKCEKKTVTKCILITGNDTSKQLM